LYILYFLLVLAIGGFIYISYKRQFVDLNEIEMMKKAASKESQDDFSQKAEEKFDNNISKEDVSTAYSQPISQDSVEEVNTPEKVDEQNITLAKDNKLPVYRNDMPIIEGVKPHFFEYFQGQKLLIVEDNKINQKILLSILKNINTPIDVADNGEEAIHKILRDRKQYDLILMDISMPVMDGIEATRRIRDDSLCDSLPIVTVTAFTSGLEIGQMFEVGANAYLTKPLDIHKLFTAMLLFLDNSKNDMPIEKEFEILEIDIDSAIKDMGVSQKDMKEFIREFISRYSDMDKNISEWIEDNNFAQIVSSLNELEMILDKIGAKGMQRFIYDMREAFKEIVDIEEYQTLFNAQHRALLNTYKKYLNSI